MAQSTRWCFTINNPTDVDHGRLNELSSSLNISVSLTLSTGEKLEMEELLICKDSLSLILESVYELLESYLDHADIMRLPELPAIRQRIIVKRTVTTQNLVRSLTHVELRPTSPTSSLGFGLI